MGARLDTLLLCVGAQKSGTTWLFNRLIEHPETRRAINKETHYFRLFQDGDRTPVKLKLDAMRRFLRDDPDRVESYFHAQALGEAVDPVLDRAFGPMNDTWYVRSFLGRGRFAMDFTPEYATLPDAAHQKIKELSERQKVIFVMREPFDRALSAIRYALKQRGEDIRDASIERLQRVIHRPAITAFSRYDQTIETLERHYAPQDLHFMIYEDMMAHKAQALDGVCDWLGIDRLDLPTSELEKRDNPTDPFDLPPGIVEDLAMQLSPVRDMIEARFPQARAAWAHLPRV